MSHQVTKKFRESTSEYEYAETDFSNILFDLGNEDFNWVGLNVTDTTLNLYDVTNGAQLNEAQKKFIFENGFTKCYLRHEDGMETTYNVSR